jgi:hypothetical protein
MKREFLENLDLGDGAKLSKETIDAIMAENGKDINTLKEEITTITTARDGLQRQLDDANTTIKSYKDMDFDGIKQSAADWETKYNDETKKLRDQMAEMQQGFVVEKTAADIKFSSESAKKAFIADLKAKKLTQQDGKLLGFDDYLKAYKESDPGAFAVETDGKGGNPQFTNNKPGTTGGSSNPANPFSFNFTSVRKTE